MRAILLTFALALSYQSAQAQTSTDSAAGFQTLLADKLKEAKPVLILHPERKPALSLFHPTWVFHDSKGVDYLEIGPGGKFQKGENPYAFIGLGVNIVALSGRFWDFDWARAHVRRSNFPPIFIGPAVYLPLDINRAREWNWRENAGASVSVRGRILFGS